MRELPNILIVDDVLSNLTYLKIILRGIEVSLIEALSGKEALEKIEGKELSMAILDVQMPGMNGYELAININRDRQSNSIPIIFLTAAFPNNDQIMVGYGAGAVDYIVKPFNRKILSSKVHIFLQLYNQKQLILESREELRRSEMEILKNKEQLQLLNRHLINAREDERAAIALLIHDELGQSLTALKIDLSWIRQNCEANSFSDKLDRMISTTNGIIHKVQRISSELHPKLLTDLGLDAAIEWYCGELQERSGLIFHLSLEEFSESDFQVDLALFRILQEALTNVIRHAEATQVRIEILNGETTIQMTIADNGQGFEPSKLESMNSMGLFGMRERAKQIQGILQISGNEPNGTKIMVLVPKQNKNSNENSNC